MEETNTPESRPTQYRKFNTYDFKKDFSKILRDIMRGEFDAAIVTSYDRPVGVFMPHPDTVKKSSP